MTNHEIRIQRKGGALGIVLVCWAFAILGAGCGGSSELVGPSEPLAQLDSIAEFNSTVLDARKPVVVLVYKEGCPACAKMERVLSHLAAEYHGRAVFVKYPMANALGIVKNAELRDKYNLFVWPTVILFFDEVEKKRWLTNDFPPDEFRKSLDEILSVRREAAGRITE